MCVERQKTLQTRSAESSPQPTLPAVFDAYFGARVAIDYQDTNTKESETSTKNLSDPEADFSQVPSNEKGNKHKINTDLSVCDPTRRSVQAEHINLRHEANDNAVSKNSETKSSMQSDLSFLGHMIVVDPNIQGSNWSIFGSTRSCVHE